MYDAELIKIECNPRRGRLPAFSFARPANWHTLAFPYPPASFDDPGYYRHHRLHPGHRRHPDDRHPPRSRHRLPPRIPRRLVPHRRRRRV
jgi:hypothetical protein